MIHNLYLHVVLNHVGSCYKYIIHRTVSSTLEATTFYCNTSNTQQRALVVLTIELNIVLAIWANIKTDIYWTQYCKIKWEIKMVVIIWVAKFYSNPGQCSVYLFFLLFKNNFIKPRLVRFVSLPVLLYEDYIDLEIHDERGYRFFPKSF